MDEFSEYETVETPAVNLPEQSWVERNGFSDWAVALIWIFVAFILFQLTAGIVAFILFMMEEGMMSNPDPQQMMEAFYEHLDLLFIGNSTGQILFLGIATWFVSRLHTAKDGHKQFMRFKVHDDTISMLGLTAMLIIAVQPVIWFFSWLNLQMPVPTMFEEMQSSQLQMIEEFIRSDYSIMLMLFHIGLVPAICEEVLYRGYILRSFEKNWGIWAAIFFSGFFFGMYHLQLTNLLPLTLIGVVLAYVTYASDSIYPAILAHLINNGGSVVVASFYPDSSLAEMTPESMPPIWALLVGLALSGSLLSYMHKKMQEVRGGNTDV